MERCVYAIFNCFTGTIIFFIFIFQFNFTYRCLLKMPYFLLSLPFGAFFLAKQFFRNHENAYMRAEKIFRFLTNSASYGVGSAKRNRFRQDARTDIPGIVETWRTYGRKNRRNEKNLFRSLYLQIPPGRRPPREATFAKPICRNIRRRRCFCDGHPLLTFSSHDPILSVPIFYKIGIETLSVTFVSLLFVFTLKKRLGYNNPNLINVTHRCGEIVLSKRIGD